MWVKAAVVASLFVHVITAIVPTVYKASAEGTISVAEPRRPAADPRDAIAIRVSEITKYPKMGITRVQFSQVICIKFTEGVVSGRKEICSYDLVGDYVGSVIAREWHSVLRIIWGIRQSGAGQLHETPVGRTFNNFSGSFANIFNCYNKFGWYTRDHRIGIEPQPDNLDVRAIPLNDTPNGYNSYNYQGESPPRYQDSSFVSRAEFLFEKSGTDARPQTQFNRFFLFLSVMCFLFSFLFPPLPHLRFPFNVISVICYVICPIALMLGLFA